MMTRGCTEFRDQLQQIQLLPALLAVCQGVRANVNNSLCMLEQYSSETCTFFMLVGEIGISPWEMQHVSGLPAGKFPYEEHVPPSAELELLKTQDPELYSTYWEVLCHFFICRESKGRARLAGFLSIWLGKCVVPTREAATVGVLLPADRLACGVRIALVPAIIAHIQHGLREVSTAFLANSSTPPRARLAYTYLVAWYVLHCTALMTPTPSLDLTTPFIGSVAKCFWTFPQRPAISQFLSSPVHFQLYH